MGETMRVWFNRGGFLDEPLTVKGRTFTKSNGSMVSRVYERLTRASRRREDKFNTRQLVRRQEEEYYRRGVYDTLKALQDEIEKN